MTATTTRPKRWAWGECPRCKTPREAFHLETCSCNDLGHEWFPEMGDDKGPARECGWCGKIIGAARMRNDYPV